MHLTEYNIDGPKVSNRKKPFPKCHFRRLFILFMYEIKKKKTSLFCTRDSRLYTISSLDIGDFSFTLAAMFHVVFSIHGWYTGSGKSSTKLLLLAIERLLFWVIFSALLPILSQDDEIWINNVWSNCRTNLHLHFFLNIAMF